VPVHLITVILADYYNTISNNEMFNFTDTAIRLPYLIPGLWTIEGNNIYEAKTQTTSLTGIFVAGQFNFVSGNYIHDLLTTGAGATGIARRSRRSWL